MSPKKKSPSSSRPRAAASPVVPPPPLEVQLAPPDVQRDEFISVMLELRERNREVFDALMTILRLAAPERSAALMLMRRASEPAPTNSQAAEALALFAEVTDPATGWCTTPESVDSTVYHIVLSRILFGDRERAGRILAAALEIATEEQLQDVVGALKEDRDHMLESRAQVAARTAGNGNGGAS